jgi:hypothetical protein
MGRGTPQTMSFAFTTLARTFHASRDFMGHFTEQLCRAIIDSADQQTLKTLVETVLGPPELRTPEAPVKSGKLYTGGTEIERSNRAIPVKSGRCYSTANSYQIAPNIASVAAGSKRTGEDRENLDLRTNINMACELWLHLHHCSQPFNRQSRRSQPSISREPLPCASATFFNDTGICSILLVLGVHSSISTRMYRQMFRPQLSLQMIVGCYP